MGHLSIPTLNLFDGFILVLTAVSVLSAFRHGLVKVAFSVSGLIVGVLAAESMQAWVMSCLPAYISSQLTFQILSFLAVAASIYGIFTVAGAAARQMASDAGMNFGDRSLGAGLGLLRSALAGAIVLVTITAVTPQSAVVKNSVFAPYLMSGTHAVSYIVPEDFQVRGDGGIPVENNALEAREHR